MAKKKPYRFILYLLVRAGAWLVYALPRSAALVLGRFFGQLAYYGVSRHRKRTLDNLRRVFGKGKSEAEIRSLAKQVFEHLAMTSVEVLQFPKLDPEKAAKLADAEEAFRVYDELLREGKGVISVTAHIGNWELLAGIVCMKGYQGGVIARRIYYEPYNEWIVRLRKSIKVSTIYRDQSSREILEILKRNEIVGILPDQDIDSLSGIFVNFFGRPAYTPVGPVKLALVGGAPIVSNFLIRKSDGRYRLVVGEVIRPMVKTTREAAVREATEQWMQSFEKVIREYPEQWAWMHNRWKTQPGDLEKAQAERPLTADVT